MGIGKFVFGGFSGETTFVSMRAKMMSHKTFEKWFAKNNADFGIVARFGRSMVGYLQIGTPV